VTRIDPQTGAQQSTRLRRWPGPLAWSERYGELWIGAFEERATDAGISYASRGAGAVWVTSPNDRTLWRIDPKTNDRTRIPMPYEPWGVAADDDDVWVRVRRK
jgi:hypothetical protein